MTKTQMVKQYMAESGSNTSYSITQAADEWIAKIQDPATVATPEAKAALISRIREALPKVKARGAANYVMACNEIKMVMSR